MADYTDQDKTEDRDYAFDATLPEEEYTISKLKLILFNISLYVLIPIVLITNLILLIKIIGNKKIRSEP